MKVKPIKIFDGKTVFFKQNKKYFPVIFMSTTSEILYLRKLDMGFNKFNKRSVCDVAGITIEYLNKIIKEKSNEQIKRIGKSTKEKLVGN